jgi:holo-[acyl-carrier protein] synthase
MLGVGTDILAIGRVRERWPHSGERLAVRILTAQERERCLACREPWRFLAKRFAAKEAIAKAMGCGIGAAVGWQDMRIDNDSAGAPRVWLSPRGEARLHSLGASRVLLSIADERDYAVAFAALVE